MGVGNAISIEFLVVADASVHCIESNYDGLVGKGLALYRTAWQRESVNMDTEFFCIALHSQLFFDSSANIRTK